MNLEGLELKNVKVFALITMAFFTMMLEACEKQGISVDLKRQQADSLTVNAPDTLSKDSPYYNTDVDEYTYEGCDYIRIGSIQHSWGSHKGNCKNPIHDTANIKVLRDSIKMLTLENKQLREENHILTSALAQRDYDKHNK
jgi:hypothetical protein